MDFLNLNELHIFTHFFKKKLFYFYFFLFFCVTYIAMPNLMPFRNYSEYDIINLFACSVEATKGTLVKPIQKLEKNPLNLSQNAPGAKYSNVVNNLFELTGRVEPIVNYNDVPTALGILLYDVREKDENGEKLILNPRKAAEMNVVLPKIHAAPVLTKGIVLINDIDVSNHGSGGGNPSIGDAAYVGDAGKISTDGLVKIGKFLSPIGSDGYALVKVDFD